MKYKLVQKGNPGDLAAPKKWYANSVNSGTVTQKSIAKEIAGRSSLTAGDVANVISNFLDLLPSHLIDGKSVQLGDFGTFRVSLTAPSLESDTLNVPKSCFHLVLILNEKWMKLILKKSSLNLE